jgi:hypothetical protein
VESVEAGDDFALERCEVAREQKGLLRQIIVQLSHIWRGIPGSDKPVSEAPCERHFRIESRENFGKMDGVGRISESRIFFWSKLTAVPDVCGIKPFTSDRLHPHFVLFLPRSVWMGRLRNKWLGGKDGVASESRNIEMDVNSVLTRDAEMRSNKKASMRIVVRAVGRIRSRRILGRQSRDVGKDLEHRQKDSETDSHSRRVGRCERNARAGLYIVSLRVATAGVWTLDTAMDYHSWYGDVDKIVRSLYRSRKRILSPQECHRSSTEIKPNTFSKTYPYDKAAFCVDIRRVDVIENVSIVRHLVDIVEQGIDHSVNLNLL